MSVESTLARKARRIERQARLCAQNQDKIAARRSHRGESFKAPRVYSAPGWRIDWAAGQLKAIPQLGIMKRTMRAPRVKPEGEQKDKKR